MKFFTRAPTSQERSMGGTVELSWNNWDDYGRKSSFHATYHSGDGREFRLGMVKILAVNGPEGRTELPDVFTALDERHVSLGQAASYYEEIASLPADAQGPFLLAMRDAAAYPAFERAASSSDGWRSSLLRFGEAENALKRGRELFAGGVGVREGLLTFDYEWHHHGGLTNVEFAFDDSTGVPGRCNALVGYNGVGKTALLADLAVSASGVGDDRRSDVLRSRITEGVTFGSVVTISYSAFDTFSTPEDDGSSSGTESFGYVYCGLRKIGRASSDVAPDGRSLKSIDEVERELSAAVDKASSAGRSAPFETALGILMEEPSFGRIGVDLQTGSGLIEQVSRLSTGHKIVLNIITQLAAHLNRRSLVLIDEPETHLHPPLMAALLRAIQSLLRATDSFAVIATHSPVVVQETVGAQVRVLERFADETSSRTPDIETFGESVGVITRNIFSLDSSATDYQGILKDLARTKSRSEIDALFQHGLSGQAFALVSSYTPDDSEDRS